MPRINRDVLDSVFFLYSTREDAQSGTNAQATGFIVACGGDLFEQSLSLYGISNWHAAVRAGASIIRLNTIDGGFDVLEFGPEDWTFIPGLDDVAIVLLDGISEHRHRVRSIPTSLFTSEADAKYKIGVGDDVFMLGLFVDHEGHATNRPKARFGNISMMPSPDAPIEQPTGHLAESYIIDMHSRDGFSGSPVFVYRTIGGDLTDSRSGQIEHDDQMWRTEDQPLRLVDKTLFKFLGIHWGQFDEPLEVLEIHESLSGRRTFVKARSGMTCVIPSWRILDVLNLPIFQEARRRLNENS
jgi:hypothetical protein